MENKPYFCNFQYYNERAQRLSIFARTRRDGGKYMMDMFIWRCSTEDNFNKKIAHDAYLRHISGETAEDDKFHMHPVIFSFPIDTYEGAWKAFDSYCRRNFYTKSTNTVCYVRDIYRKNPRAKKDGVHGHTIVYDDTFVAERGKKKKIKIKHNLSEW